jgi:hypothetical protein
MSRVILKQPVAVFDAGIGSYAMARKIADWLPISRPEDLSVFAEGLLEAGPPEW